MDTLELQIIIDDIAKSFLNKGKTPDQIREILMDEADRVASEIESGMWE